MKKVLMKTISPIIPQEFLLRNIHRVVLTAKHLNIFISTIVSMTVYYMKYMLYSSVCLLLQEWHILIPAFVLGIQNKAFYNSNHVINTKSWYSQYTHSMSKQYMDLFIRVHRKTKSLKNQYRKKMDELFVKTIPKAERSFVPLLKMTFKF